MIYQFEGKKIITCGECPFLRLGEGFYNKKRTFFCILLNYQEVSRKTKPAECPLIEIGKEG